MTIMGNPVVADVEAAQAAQVRVHSPAVQAIAAAQVAALAEDVGARCLSGSSPSGFALAGAAAAVCGLPVLSPMDVVDGPALVVESVLVTGAGVGRTVVALSPEVGPVVVVAAAVIGAIPDWLEQMVDKIVVLSN